MSKSWAESSHCCHGFKNLKVAVVMLVRLDGMPHRKAQDIILTMTCKDLRLKILKLVCRLPFLLLVLNTLGFGPGRS